MIFVLDSAKKIEYHKHSEFVWLGYGQRQKKSKLCGLLLCFLKNVAAKRGIKPRQFLLREPQRLQRWQQLRLQP